MAQYAVDMKGKIHGARPPMGSDKARRSVRVFLAEVDQGVVRTYEDYLDLANETHLPHALGSLVVNYGHPGQTRAVRTLSQKRNGWGFWAKATRAPHFTHVELRHQRRAWVIGPPIGETLAFGEDNAASGWARKEAGFHSEMFQLNTYWRSDADGRFANEADLAGFLNVSEIVMQELLNTIVTLQPPAARQVPQGPDLAATPITL